MRKNRMKFGKGVKKYADGGSTEMEDLEQVTVTARKKPYSYDQKYNFPSRGGMNAGMGAGTQGGGSRLSPCPEGKSYNSSLGMCVENEPASRSSSEQNPCPTGLSYDPDTGLCSPSGYRKGGKVKESKAMMRKEVAFMKKKGAPKSMIKHEEKEYGMRRGGMAKSGGSYRRAADGIASKGKTKGHVVKMAGGGVASSYRRNADGIASKGKTKGKMVKMMGGGYCG